jgi:hypothetical protein
MLTCEGIERTAVLPNLVMQVGTGGAARRSDKTDNLALPNLLTLGHHQARQMRVARLQPVRVLDHHQQPITTRPIGRRNTASVSRRHRGTRWRGEVDAGVRPRTPACLLTPLRKCARKGIRC